MSASPLKALLAIANLGRAFVKNGVTGRYDVGLSSDSGNTLSYGTDGNIMGGQFKSAIQLGDTTPVPAGGNGSIAYSTLLNELVQWVTKADGTGSWAKRYVGTTDAGGSALPAVTVADNDKTLVVVNGAWTKFLTPFQGPILASWSNPIN